MVSLNSALTNVIVKECKGMKKILLTFSGGMDTRLVLAIMLNNGIKPDLLTWDGSEWEGSRNDISISKSIANDLDLHQIIVHKITTEDGWLDSVNKVLEGYDVIFYGELMSEVFNKFVRFTESEKKLNDIIDNYYDWVKHNVNRKKCNKVFPCLDKDVMDVALELPLCYRVYGYVNRKLINYNYPLLLKYPHTTVNIRYRFIECLYWMCVPILEYYIK